MIIRKYQNKRITYNIQYATIRYIFVCFAFCVLGFAFCYAQESAEKAKVTASLNVTVSTESTPAKNESSDIQNIMLEEAAKEPFLEPETVLKASAAKVSEAIIINGDKIEFSTDNKDVIVTGNAEVISKGTKLTCQKLVINNQTKEGVAEGNARLDEEAGSIEGPKIIYNFNTGSGTIIDADFRTNPYFGRSEKLDKIADTQFINRRGYLTTCNFARPHWKFKSRKMVMYPGDKVELYDNLFYLSKAPLFYMPKFSRSLRDPLMHVQMVPGKDKNFGYYMLSAWRYNLTEDVTGRIYFDVREKYGVSEGAGSNYTTSEFGKGDFKFYYTQERNKNVKEMGMGVDNPKVFQRYLIRWRHQWDADKNTKLTSEYYHIVDSKRILYPDHSPTYNFLKDYFYREYEKDMQPLSYITAHRNFNYSSLDFIMQPRTNRWYSQLEKLPEMTFSLPSYQFGESYLYFANTSQFGNYLYQNAVPSPSSANKQIARFDTTNKFSRLTKLLFLNLEPFAQYEGTWYNHDVSNRTGIFRSIFSTGTSASTKFYRIFNLKSNMLGLDVNGLRHIITPLINYTYRHYPTVTSNHLIQIDGVDATSGNSNSSTLELSNILQTKRQGATYKLAELLVNNTYTFKTSGTKSSLGDFKYKLYVYPYSWLSLTGEATYQRKEKYFSQANYDLNLTFSSERSFGFSQRYQRKGPNEFVGDLQWRLNPKWKFSIYERFLYGHRDSSFRRGLREQEYVLSRDLHCWTIDFTYNVKRDEGESVWLVFKLKAFPEFNFEYNQEYHKPKTGELGYH